MLLTNQLLAQTIDTTYSDSLKTATRDSIYNDSVARAKFVEYNYINNNIYKVSKVIHQKNGEFRFWKNGTDSLMRWEIVDSTGITIESIPLDSPLFHIDTVLIQNNSVFKIWVHKIFYGDIAEDGSADGPRGNILAIERITATEDTIIGFDYYYRDADLECKDVNNDGFSDFIVYKDYQSCPKEGHDAMVAISIFDTAKNMFNNIFDSCSCNYDFYRLQCIDSSKSLYMDSQFRGLGSTLYSFKGTNPNWLYQIEYKKDTKGAILYKHRKNKSGDDNDNVNEINRIFIKRIPEHLLINIEDDSEYWRTHYKQLLGYK